MPFVQIITLLVIALVLPLIVFDLVRPGRKIMDFIKLAFFLGVLPMLLKAVLVFLPVGVSIGLGVCWVAWCWVAWQVQERHRKTIEQPKS